MPARQNIVPTVYTGIRLPLDVRTQMDLYLFSEYKGRVPKGAHQQFITQLIRDFFAKAPANDQPSSP